MDALLDFVLSRWLTSFVGVAVIVALVWLFAPLWPPLEDPIRRVIVIVVLLLIWFGVNGLISLRRRKRERALEAGVTAGAPDQTKIASEAERAAIADKLSTSLAMLKKARGRRGYLYEQPWYVIIGPPGAGKTTALLNAGLQFPLAAEMGMGAVAGVGGTRLCDWWFTDNAVLIDTAGRYTTQDSDAAVDRAGWEGFLDLLRRTRPRQPINGALVAISITDIASGTREERLAHARSIRRRIKDLVEKLGVKVPVYAIFTKADLLAGFTEFFDDLDRDTRAQVWGTTFPLDRSETGPVGRFAAEFTALVERLNARLLPRMQAERSPDRRALIAGFPAQVSTLQAPLMEFLTEAFGGSRLDPAPLLRGVYFASGTQEGTPIDRLTGTLARAFGLDQRRAPALRPEQGRSYFLGRLLKDVVFGEAMMVSRNPRAVRRTWVLRGLGYAAVLLAVLAGGGLIWQSRAAQQAQVSSADANLAAYQQAVSQLKLDPVADADLGRVVPMLDLARALPDAPAASPVQTAWFGFGLSQRGKLETAGQSVYRNALHNILLPRLIWRLESQMRGNLNNPDFLYQATRVYLMLGGQGPLDRELVTDWMTLDWNQALPGPVLAPMRQDLGVHLAALLADPLPAVTLDGALVQASRATFSRVPIAQRVYSRILPSQAAKAVPQWRPADPLGPAGAQIFLRLSGKPLSDGVPGFFTIDGFYKVLLPALGNVAKEVAGESWVLGQAQQIDPASPEMQQLSANVVKLYEADYAKQWDGMIADLDTRPLTSIKQASDDLYVLSSPQSPMKSLLVAMVRQLTLTQPPAPPPGAVAPTEDQKKAQLAALAAVQQSIAPGTADAPALALGHEIDDRYKALRDFVGNAPGAPIDTILKMMSDLQLQLAKAADPTSGGAPAPTGIDPAAQLIAAAVNTPEPVSRWIKAMATNGDILRKAGTKAQMQKALAAAANGPGGPASLCAKAVDGRYPFTPGASDGIPLDDFTRLFSPGGLLDGFFNQQLRAVVDTSGSTWKVQQVDGVTPPVSPGDLAAFQRAARIRDLFFATGGAPTVRFDITPQDLDAGARQVTIDFGGVVVDYAHGPQRATQITWPGPNGMGQVRLTFDPPADQALQASGPWALFRLFGQGTLTQGASSERYTLTFRQGERMASFDLRAGSVLNPFAPGVLTGFHCPAFQ